MTPSEIIRISSSIGVLSVAEVSVCQTAGPIRIFVKRTDKNNSFLSVYYLPPANHTGLIECIDLFPHPGFYAGVRESSDR
jgi:hypothetical protein